MKTLLLVLVLLFPFGASAHGDTPSFETEVGSYLVDIGYSTENPTTEEALLFDFSITNSGKEVLFSDVWVRIEDENKAVVLATGVHNAAFGGPRLSYVFPKEGTYTIFTRFENQDSSIAEASFPLTISSSESFPTGNYLFGVLGLIIGALGAFLAVRRKSV